MKRLLTIAVILAAALLAGCPNPNSGDDNNPPANNPSAVDFTSRNTDYSILVRNNTGEKLVAFKGDLTADKL
ncbi:MAG: hypothetical protein LBG76_07930, partial [Treponema sp.]|nr:hypothetical protein [Treponema sp.]